RSHKAERRTVGAKTLGGVIGLPGAKEVGHPRQHRITCKAFRMRSRRAPPGWLFCCNVAYL
ncbi:MAG: hypothetical protein ACPLPR_06970, partial [Bacillota bacterium]